MGSNCQSIFPCLSVLLLMCLSCSATHYQSFSASSSSSLPPLIFNPPLSLFPSSFSFKDYKLHVFPQILFLIKKSSLLLRWTAERQTVLMMLCINPKTAPQTLSNGTTWHCDSSHGEFTEWLGQFLSKSWKPWIQVNLNGTSETKTHLLICRYCSKSLDWSLA